MHYCMRCEDLTQIPVVATREEAVCPACGYAQRVPLGRLFVVTGASGTGKSALVPHLREALSECDVYDSDLLAGLAEHGWDTVFNTWLTVAHGAALNGRTIVLCGSLMPDRLENLPARTSIGAIHFCNLDCPDDELAMRLRARPAWRGWDDDGIREHQRFAAHLRRHITPNFDTSVGSPEETARQVADWVRNLLREHQAERWTTDPTSTSR